jgi:hypothetical protein
MKYLFDSTGKHIANEVDGRLHDVHGANIGHFLIQPRIFVDLAGQYLGEIVSGNRLMAKTASVFRRTWFGRRGRAGDAGSFGHPGNAGALGTRGGFKDIPAERLSG